MKNILDLRFIIGFFFLLVGLFLLIGSFVLHPSGEKTEVVNRWCGIFYIVFSLVMLALWQRGKDKITAEFED